ncbi:MAG: undecaprenyl/decaprenyl-phosphate alpha-N-acetylglucosaminyl 1-phosphate transferase [Chloroflexi bacterium]|nr:undecaprenyl/decaprenyl-phosphate alpha-N-acetylglucosaminyl 1-phosphate transferase [Chloroflexota bacterium]
MPGYRLFLLIFLAACAAILLSPPAVWISRRLGLMDIPRREQHKQHRRPVPLAGGIVLFAAFLILAGLSGAAAQPEFLAYLLPMCIIFGFGLLDDFIGLKPHFKLAGQVLAAGLIIHNGISVQLVQNPAVNFAISLVWLVGIANAFNFIDSMDGLAVGLSALAAACLMLVTLQSEQFWLTGLTAILLGNSVGIFYFNAPPARYFLGDSGAQLLGFLLAAIAMEYAPVGYTLLTSWFVPILLFAVPIFDTLLVVVSRLRRRLPVYQAGLDHTYHRLVRLGVSSNRAILTMHIAALLIDCMAFILLNLSPLLSNGLLALLVLLGMGAITFLDRPHLLEDHPYPSI